MSPTTLSPKSTIRSITWTVPSAREAGTEYTVSAASPTDVLRCTCHASDYPKTRGRCWHIKAVHAGLAGKPVIRLTVTPRPAAVAA